MSDVIKHEIETGGCDIDGEEDSWDFGTGAGFYVDATEKPWNENYRMYSYVTKEVSKNDKTLNRIVPMNGVLKRKVTEILLNFKAGSKYKLAIIIVFLFLLI